jgi:hypothetical protein
LPTDTRRQARTEPIEQGQLARVPQRITVRVCLERHPQADDGRRSACQIDAEIRYRAPLDPAPMRMRDARGGRCRPLAQSASGPPDPQLIAQGDPNPTTASITVGQRATSLGHDRRIARRAHRRLNPTKRRQSVVSAVTGSQPAETQSAPPRTGHGD